MTIWIPDITPFSGPKYLAIANAIEQAISCGTLKNGDKLPPQRELAYQLGITLSTVTRAYTEIERRKLARGETGRGTFISTEAPKPSPLLPSSEEASVYDLARNFAFPFLNPDLEDALQSIARDANALGLNSYTPSEGLLRHREAGVQFMRDHYSVAAHPDNTLICCGAQHAIHVLFQTLFNTGDAVGVDELTYPSILYTAAQLNLKLIPIRNKRLENGGRAAMDPDALKDVCETHSLKGLFLIPNVQNPTTHTMTEQERRDIAEIAEEHRLTIIEDDPYTPFLSEDLPSFSSFLPDLTCTIATPSKVMAPGMRTAYISAPDCLVPIIRQNIGASVWMAPPLNAEIVAHWISNGEVSKTLAKKTAASRIRFHEAKEILKGHLTHGAEEKVFLWLEAPKNIDASAIETELAHNKIKILGAHHFREKRRSDQSGLRIALGTIEDDAQFTYALKILRKTLDSHADGPSFGELSG